MQTSRRGRHVLRAGQAIIAVLLLLSLTTVLTACGGNAQVQQQAAQSKTQLDQLLQHAQSIGVPSASLQPVLAQEQQLNGTSAPLSLFNSQPVDQYYHNLATRYTQLQLQTQGVITTTTAQDQSLAQRAMQDFQTALTRQQVAHLPVQYFEQQFSLNQSLLAAAHDPKDYVIITKNAHSNQQALDALQTTAGQLKILNTTIQQMQTAKIDITAMQTQYQNDQALLTAATNIQSFQTLSTLIDAQYQQAIVTTTLAIPYVTAAKLSELATQIAQLKQYGMDASAYQKRLDADHATMQQTKTLAAYQTFAKQIDADIASMHDTLVQGEASYLIKQFHQEVDSWGQAHLYHDSFNGQNYVLDAGYQQAGIGSDLDNALANAYTPDDYQSVVDEAQNALFNLHLMEQDYSDKTPYNQVHATDMAMLDHYQLQGKQVLMVSLAEQAMRVYQDGKLVNSFQVTTGRNELPSVPGVWPTLDRLSPTVFKSPDPPGSPYWYPDTPIHYAILYHWGGYFVHDSWWRVNYGPGTQFPHYDTGGDESFAGSGSHGCVNMQEQQAAWVYANTNWNTMIVIY